MRIQPYYFLGGKVTKLLSWLVGLSLSLPLSLSLFEKKTQFIGPMTLEAC